MKTKQNFTLVRGDTLTVRFLVTDSVEARQDLTGMVVALNVRDAQRKRLISKSSVYADQIRVTDAAAGELEVYFVPADTTSLKSDTYPYDLETTLDIGSTTTGGVVSAPASDTVVTVSSGIVWLVEDYTY